ncbi:transporter substrate-binding domain-containing protein [Roseibium aggregatum]|uniref:Transporter substrate-binding domain-containing protein n=1 Tax=Roseibium aggregatum TaxID=187304 RepID=A0A926S764_9HYPH|nr:transporter substrate-binding domain-containing protein [Roseibium aggregatum]MBD1548301.1 transporter substrate-binding domain-containing protein [Roseibium aggregatum]
MARKEIPIGVLFSTTGPYSVIGREACWGARIAIDEINASDAFDFTLRGIEADPRGEADRYATLADRLMRKDGCRHIIGCQTSWSRKEVHPVLERLGGLLWYPTPYEGFESHDRVIYTGACPNQNVVPLFQYAVPAFGNRAFLVGSNYIWGWEINRIARELLGGYGGSVLGERYIPIGDQEIGHLIEEIRLKRPDFILNNLIGTSSYAFLKAYRKLGEEDPFFHPSRCPVLSCNLTEAELPVLGEAAEGLISTSTYFQTLDTVENRSFTGGMRLLRGPDASVSHMFVGPYLAVWLLARAIAATGSDDPDGIVAGLPDMPLLTPLGPVRIERKTQHAYLTPYIGVVEGAGEERPMPRFRLLDAAATEMAPDPYLVDYDPHAGADANRPFSAGGGQGSGPKLRLVT